MNINIIGLIIQLISGAIGGNIAGKGLKQYDLGTIGNSVAGIVGGGVGGQLLTALLGTGAAAGGNSDIGSIIAQIAGGGVGGGILMIIVGIIRQAMSTQSARS
jgi:uncharacterized membrane protein YeaQ/YmgE (transglycosylase-associated protein family)